MTLTELKYIVAVAREKHFGRAADACLISQPTLSVSIKKLEEEIDIKIFERSANEVVVTPLGQEIISQAQAVLEQATRVYEIAKRGKDPLAAPLRLGVIYTIGPYLLPELVKQNIMRTPQMPFLLQENFTRRLLEMLRNGEIDCAILAEPFPSQGFASMHLYDEPFVVAVPSTHALAQQTAVSADELRNGEIDCAILAEPFPSQGFASMHLYDEPFVVAVPSTHALAQQTAVSADELRNENMLLLGAEHCFRDHVLEICPESARLSSSYASGGSGIQRSFEGSSLETIKHMVAAGMGVTVIPRLSVPPGGLDAGSRKKSKGSDIFIKYIPFAGDAPTRRVVLVWRRSYTRYEAMAELRNAVMACDLEGVLRPE